MKLLTEYVFGLRDLWHLIRYLYRRAAGMRRQTLLKLLLIVAIELGLVFWMGYGVQGIFFWGFFLASFLFGWDGRVAIGFALVGLVLIPILLAPKQYAGWILADLWAEEVAVWVYFFLVIGVVRQAWELSRQSEEPRPPEKLKRHAPPPADAA